jgi:H+/Cl- antiporter ClcA
VDYPTVLLSELVILVLLGVMGGAWGSLFVHVNGRGLAAWRRLRLGGRRARYKRLAELALVAALCSAVSVLLPAIWACRPLTPQEQQALADKGQRLSWKAGTCPAGMVNEMATLTFQVATAGVLWSYGGGRGSGGGWFANVGTGCWSWHEAVWKRGKHSIRGRRSDSVDG